jgi:hypothetical protein
MRSGRPANSFRDRVHRLDPPIRAPGALTVVPGWIRLLLGGFVPSLRDIPEIPHHWAEPVVIDDRSF